VTLHDDAVRVLSAWTATSPEADEARRRTLDLLHDGPAAVARAHRPGHVTASTLVLGGDRRVLLCLHGRMNRWMQLGGHCEPGDRTLAAAALREATEESGLAGLELDPGPVQLSEHAVPFCGDAGNVHHLDVRFVAVAPDGAEHAVSDESLDVRWWPVDALPDPEPDLVEAIALARERVRQSSSNGGGSSLAAADQPIR
jgi:8-oxo-dGTP pyrophosphatase MutT (NUDIX family)